MNHQETHTQEQCVLRKQIRKSVVIATQHPVIGPVYWQFVSNADCNAPDDYGLTGRIEEALRLGQNWRQSPTLKWNYDQFLSNLNEWAERNYDHPCDPGSPFRRSFTNLAKKAGQSLQDFCEWLCFAHWQDAPAPPRTLYLRDFNGFLNYAPVWTESIDEATKWSQEEIDDDKELDTMLAKKLGEFVPFEEDRFERTATR
jgi:hypothetical protein